MYTVYHGSWRDFGTAVGAIVCTEMNTIFGATFAGHRMYNVCTLYVRAMKVSQWLTEVYRERLAWTRSVRCAHTAHASLMGAYAPKRSANRALSREDGAVCWAVMIS